MNELRLFNVEWSRTETTSCLVLATSIEQATEIAMADKPNDRWGWTEHEPAIDQLYAVPTLLLGKLSPKEVVIVPGTTINLEEAQRRVAVARKVEAQR